MTRLSRIVTLCCLPSLFWVATAAATGFSLGSLPR
jgi:hypothetical protein